MNAKFNAEVGSKVDGVLANDFLILSRRIALDARGHTKKKPIAISKKSTMGDQKSPVQVEFFSEDGLKVYDPIKRRNLTEEEVSGKTFTSSFTLHRFSRLRFAAKVALATGYFVFGEWFRQNVAHDELRTLMNLDSSPSPEDFEGFRIQVYDEFTQPSEADQQQFVMDEAFCRIVKGSCVYFVPGPVNLGVTVGVLGEYLATLNIPAKTDEFPFSDENDLGHTVLLENGQMERISYRQFARRVYDKLQLGTIG
ncbi:hypothetical protein [Herbaspirillum sp. SJZ099]|uniref:hypothetical protein n=1 Tax=Herbaspirillum sp. SJZ099 TaxID=2572916 RepID=UPI0011A7098B|nr:hypothetical protein [Herbaspirillum sp. SJZ099]